MITASIDFANPPWVELIRTGRPPLSTSLANRWAELVENLRCFRHLDDDWDGQGAAAPPGDLVDAALALAEQFAANDCIPADRAIASVSGTVYFEWHLSAGFLEIEVTAAHEADGRWVRHGSNKTDTFVLAIGTPE